MDERNKSFEKFIEAEMAKSPEQIEKEVMETPGYPKLTPKPESYEKLRKRIQSYEDSQKTEGDRLEKSEKVQSEKVKDEKMVFMQLSEEDQEALRLGRELQAKQREAAEKENKKVVVYHKKKSRKFHRKAVVAAAAALVLTMGMGINSVGGPKQVLETMNQMFGERSRTSVDSDTGENTLLVEENEEEKAYQQIKDELGFDPVRMGYMPENTTFQKMELDIKFQDVYFYYTSNKGDIIYTMRRKYTDGKGVFDIEDILVSEDKIEIDGKEIRIAEYYVKDLEVNKYLVEFIYDDTWYCIMGETKRNEIEKIVKNLIFC